MAPLTRIVRVMPVTALNATGLVLEDFDSALEGNISPPKKSLGASWRSQRLAEDAQETSVDSLFSVWAPRRFTVHLSWLTMSLSSRHHGRIMGDLLGSLMVHIRLVDEPPPVKCFIIEAGQLFHSSRQLRNGVMVIVVKMLVIEDTTPRTALHHPRSAARRHSAYDPCLI